MGARTCLQSKPKHFLRQMAVIGCATAVLVGCAPVSSSKNFIETLASSSDVMADKALAALARGDYAEAEKNVTAALKKNPRHPYALLAGGILYQNTNRPLKARALYEDLLSLQAPQTATVSGWTQMQPVLLSDIAQRNMQFMETGQTAPYPQAQTGTGVASLSPVSPQLAPVSASRMPSYPTTSYSVAPAQPVAVLDPETKAIADRFMVLRDLRDAQLVSIEEYARRRNANLGGLLPLTKSPPSKGLDRAVPGIDQVVSRLKALQQSLLSRSITPREHAVERELILDALLPAKPEALARPRPAPRSLIAAADRTRQLEHLRSMGLITAKETKAEQMAVERALQASMPRVSQGVATPVGNSPQILIPGNAVQPAIPHPESVTPAQSALNDSITVHLSSYRSRAKALAGWRGLKKKYRSQLGTLAADIRKISVPNKGTFYRLHVGPLDSRAAANRLCVSLRKKRQFCSVSD